MRKFTAQEVETVGLRLRHDHQFTRGDIREWLKIMAEYRLADIDVDKMHEKICGQATKKEPRA